MKATLLFTSFTVHPDEDDDDDDEDDDDLFLHFFLQNCGCYDSGSGQDCIFMITNLYTKEEMMHQPLLVQYFVGGF